MREPIGRSQASIAALKRDIRTKSGSPLLDFILAPARAVLVRGIPRAQVVAAVAAGIALVGIGIFALGR